MRYRLALLIALLLACPAAVLAADGPTALTWHDGARDRDVPVNIYLPDTDKPAAVVLFSPGLGGTRDGYSQWAKAWSAHGYAVVVMQHVGSDRSIFTPGSGNTKESAMSGKEYIARTQDVKFVIDELSKRNAEAGDPLEKKLDLKHIAMAGHSYGAVTSQAMVGQAASVGGKTLTYGDARISCGILMSPSPPRNPRMNDSLAAIKLPLLHLTGTLDDAPVGNIVAKDRRVPFEQIKSSPQYLITFKDADHAVFGGDSSRRLRPEKKKLDQALHPLIIEATTHFLDAQLRDDPAAKAWMANDLTKAIGQTGVVEQK